MVKALRAKDSRLTCTMGMGPAPIREGPPPIPQNQGSGMTPRGGAQARRHLRLQLQVRPGIESCRAPESAGKGEVWLTQDMLTAACG